LDIRDYHERTKHHFDRYARSKGTLDWETQPEPFREFEGAPKVALGFDFPDESLYEDLFRPGVAEPGPLDAAVVADLFFHSLAVSAIKKAGPSQWALRVNPSSGNLHPTEGYAILPALAGIGESPGVYHYLPRDHVLERRATLSAETFAALTAGLPPGSFLLGLSSITWREAWKYGERAFRYCQHDTGHAVAALSLAAAMRGRQVRVLGWSHDVVDTLLGLDRAKDFPVAEEREEAELIAAVSPGPAAAVPSPEKAVLEGSRTAVFTGLANELSPAHDEWEVIGHAAKASRNPGVVLDGGSPASDVTRSPGRPDHDARTLVRTRRSAQRFDGRSSISREGFVRILLRTLPGRCPPFSALPLPPALHLAVFVHRVEGLAPGLYLLCRDPRALDRLRAAMRDDFLWRRPEGLPDGLPLHLLQEGDCRALAAKLSCTQDIAGASFFSLGMIADFAASLDARGPWLYRHLFWESGIIGQMLYLEAEAEGGRGTGIGCYFDDGVHDLLGLAGREFQSLYHFTVGNPIEDTRLSSLPSYPTKLRGTSG
jgi:SagB-type dehydrogenase family enzyme